MLNNNSTHFPVISTERLILRRLSIEDEQEIFSLRSDSEINKYLDRPACKTIEDARNFINKVNENVENNNSLYWAIALRDTNKMVGTICLYCFSDDFSNCEIGYELLQNYQRKGIMQEAIEKVIDYAFNTINVQNMEAFLHRENQSSINLLDKFSFSYSNCPDEANPDFIIYRLSNANEDHK